MSLKWGNPKKKEDIKTFSSWICWKELISIKQFSPPPDFFHKKEKKRTKKNPSVNSGSLVSSEFPSKNSLGVHLGRPRGGTSWEFVPSELNPWAPKRPNHWKATLPGGPGTGGRWNLDTPWTKQPTSARDGYLGYSGCEFVKVSISSWPEVRSYEIIYISLGEFEDFPNLNVSLCIYIYISILRWFPNPTNHPNPRGCFLPWEWMVQKASQKKIRLKSARPLLKTPSFTVLTPEIWSKITLLLPGTPRPSIYKSLFQLDDEPNLYIEKWLEITKHPFIKNDWPWGSSFSWFCPTPTRWAPYQSYMVLFYPRK